MKAVSIASRLGISDETFDNFLQGTVPSSIAERVFCANADAIQKFVDGEPSLVLADFAKVGEDALRDLRDSLGREGAIGLLIGLALPREAPPKST